MVVSSIARPKFLTLLMIARCEAPFPAKMLHAVSLAFSVATLTVKLWVPGFPRPAVHILIIENLMLKQRKIIFSCFYGLVGLIKVITHILLDITGIVGTTFQLIYCPRCPCHHIVHWSHVAASEPGTRCFIFGRALAFSYASTANAGTTTW